MGFGWLEITLILVIVLIIFGVGKLPQIGSGLGEGIRNFKKSIKDDDDPSDTPQIEEKSSTDTK